MDSNMKFSGNIDVDYDWHLTDACNFNCVYCFPQIKAKKNSPFTRKIVTKNVVAAFDNTGKSSNINMSGGEPFLFPDFINVCIGLTQKHHIGINTNLSVSAVDEFAAKIDPKKVSYIWAAVHLDERQKLKDGMKNFAKRYNLLKSKGFNISIIYVLHPSKLSTYKVELEYIKSFGIDNIMLKVFKGMYDGQEYPQSFPDSVKDEIIANSGGYQPSKTYLKGNQDFHGKLCYAGQKFFKICVDGKVERCASDSTDYGNIYDGNIRVDETPQPCRIRKVLALSQCTRFVIADK